MIKDSSLTIPVNGGDAGRWVMRDTVLYPDVIHNLGRIELDGGTQRIQAQQPPVLLDRPDGDQQTILHHYYNPAAIMLGRTNLPTMPANTDLVRNGDFSDGYGNWLRFGDATRTLHNGVMAFKRDGSGSEGGVFYSFPYTVPANATLELVLDLGNSSPLTKTVDVLLHDREDSFSCQFTIPPNTPLQPYVLRSSIGTDWSLPRLEIRPNADNAPDLLLDNVELYYRPELNLNQTGCYGPSTAFVWDMISSPQGWTILSGLTNPRQHATGGITYDIMDNTPLLASPIMQDVQANSLNMLMIQLASSKNTCVRVSFQTEDSPIQVDFEVEADGAKHIYFVDMTKQLDWVGAVSRMFVQPMCDVNQGGTFRLHSIGLTNDTDILRLLAPQNIITNGYGNPVYRWNEMDDATHYQLFVADEYNQEVIHTALDASYCIESECQTDVTLLDEAYRLENGDYQVYIRAWYDQNPGIWTGPFEFTLDAAPPAPPTLTVATKTDTSRPHFNWRLTNMAANAVWFRVVLADDDMLLVDAWFKRSDHCDDSGLCSVPSPVDLRNGDYNLYVRSWGPGGLSMGDKGGFAGPLTVQVAVPRPAAPTGMSVTIDNDRPTISWHDDEGAAWYRVYIGEDNGSILHLDWHEKPAICNGMLCTFTPNLILTNGTFQIFVQAWGIGGYSEGGFDGWGGPAEFTIEEGAPIRPVQLHSSELGSGQPLLSWQTVTGATWYRVWVGTLPDLDNRHSEWYIQDDLGCTDVCTVQLDIVLPNGDYAWFVQGWGPGGFGNWSEQAEFTVAARRLQPPTPLTPTTIAQMDELTFAWTHERGVSWYQLEIRTSIDESDTLHVDWYALSDMACGITCQLT